MTQFYKLLSCDLWHNGFCYKEGLNVDHMPFNPSGECEPGGLYYTTLEHLPRWYTSRWPLIADVTVPDNARVYAEPCGTKWKADRLVLSNIRPLTKFFAGFDEDTMCRLLAQNGDMLVSVENQTEVMCLAAAHRNGWALQFAKKQTDEMCLAVVQHYPYALFYVHKQTDAICLAAVKNNGNALKYVENQTDEICLAAVQNAGSALMHVLNQTEPICLAAVQQDGNALCCVENQTEATCRAAVAQCPGAREFVKIPITF